MRKELEYKFDITKDLGDHLGISNERKEELLSHDFCGLHQDHTIAQHLFAIYNRQDVTIEELVYVFYMFGSKAGQMGTMERLAQQLGGMLIQVPEGMELPELKNELPDHILDDEIIH